MWSFNEILVKWARCDQEEKWRFTPVFWSMADASVVTRQTQFYRGRAPYEVSPLLQLSKQGPAARWNISIYEGRHTTASKVYQRIIPFWKEAAFPQGCSTWIKLIVSLEMIEAPLTISLAASEANEHRFTYPKAQWGSSKSIPGSGLHPPKDLIQLTTIQIRKQHLLFPKLYLPFI